MSAAASRLARHVIFGEIIQRSDGGGIVLLFDQM
jgi:hypothetical protein